MSYTARDPCRAARMKWLCHLLYSHVVYPCLGHAWLIKPGHFTTGGELPCGGTDHLSSCGLRLRHETAPTSTHDAQTLSVLTRQCQDENQSLGRLASEIGFGCMT